MLVVLGFLLLSSLALAQMPVFDIVITNGHIIDGTGSPWYSGDLGIRDGRSRPSAIWRPTRASARLTLAARSWRPDSSICSDNRNLRFLSTHACPRKFTRESHPKLLARAIRLLRSTTRLIQSGHSQYDYYKLTPDWRTFREYFARLEKQGMGINLASYVGATQVRRFVLGEDDKQPTPDQLAQMGDAGA